MATAETYDYPARQVIVRGTHVYWAGHQFDAETLELLAQAEIPRPERPQRQQPAEAP